MIRVRISDDALQDLDDGFWFYEAQEAGLGEYFSTHLRADIEGLKVSAGIHRQMYKNYRRLLSHLFPYMIYYSINGDEAIVWAVIDCRRDPEWIRRNLEM